MYTRCACIFFRAEYNFINITKTIMYYLVCEVSYHKTVRVDKETFKKTKSCLYFVLQKGEIREESLGGKKMRGTKEIRFASSLWLPTEHLSYGNSFLNLLGFA